MSVRQRYAVLEAESEAERGRRMCLHSKDGQVTTLEMESTNGLVKDIISLNYKGFCCQVFVVG